MAVVVQLSTRKPALKATMFVCLFNPDFRVVVVVGQLSDFNVPGRSVGFFFFFFVVFVYVQDTTRRIKSLQVAQFILSKSTLAF